MQKSLNDIERKCMSIGKIVLNALLLRELVINNFKTEDIDLYKNAEVNI